MWKPQKAPFVSHKKQVFRNTIKIAGFIYQIGESEQLRKPSKEVSLTEIPTKEFQAKIAYLKSCLQKYRKLTGMGRGITAVQVGIPECLSVVWMPEVKGKILVLINPKIIKQSKECLRYPEMCMSAAPLIAPVVRPSWVEVSYYNEKGEKQVWNQKDKLYNRVLQHEIDHMRGIINIDRVQSKELIFESDPTFYDNATFETV